MRPWPRSDQSNMTGASRRNPAAGRLQIGANNRVCTATVPKAVTESGVGRKAEQSLLPLVVRVGQLNLPTVPAPIWRAPRLPGFAAGVWPQ